MSSTNDRDELWVSDAATKTCFGCERVFAVARRRHHCRRCGACVCDRCSGKRVRSSTLSSSRDLAEPPMGSDEGSVSNEWADSKGERLDTLLSRRVCVPCAREIDAQRPR